MSKKIRIVLAQLNLTVGDISGNVAKLIQAANTARDTLKGNVIVFPELCLTGYPPEDLLLRKAFLQTASEALDIFKSTVEGIYCLVGHPQETSQGLLNTCSIIYNKTVLGRYAKQCLPNYGVFDEQRCFIPGNSACIVPINGIPVGVIICEDIWRAAPAQQAAYQGARLLLIPNASPFEIDKYEQRQLLLEKRAKANNLPILYVNYANGQDDLLFDGGSMAVDQTGKVCHFAGFCQEKLLPIEIEMSSGQIFMNETSFIVPTKTQRIYDALVLGVRDYIQKNNFPGALVGVSGGIDSALTLAVAVDAIGKDKVHAVMMPSRYTSDISTEDSLALIKNLGVTHEIISIEPVFNSFLASLAPLLKEKKPDVTEENIQARCRGVILMAISNKTGNIVLTTGNHSEMSVGYATLYGDMVGGFAVLKDVPKTLVYQLAHWRNQIKLVIPKRTLERAPTAELAPNQKDQDSLPPYEILDKILELYIQQEQSMQEIITRGFDATTVEKIIKLIKRNEYKRRQAAIGVRINHKAFGRDRRYPITSGFKG